MDIIRICRILEGIRFLAGEVSVAEGRGKFPLFELFVYNGLCDGRAAILSLLPIITPEGDFGVSYLFSPGAGIKKIMLDMMKYLGLRSVQGCTICRPPCARMSASTIPTGAFDDMMRVVAEAALPFWGIDKDKVEISGHGGNPRFSLCFVSTGPVLRGIFRCEIRFEGVSSSFATTPHPQYQAIIKGEAKSLIGALQAALLNVCAHAVSRRLPRCPARLANTA